MRINDVESLNIGWKSVELAQAYILMSIYSVPARRWEDDRSWLYAGLAIRCGDITVYLLEQQELILSCPLQHRHGSELASTIQREAHQRTPGTRDTQSDENMDDLLQSR